jgi:hypothetical protein
VPPRAAACASASASQLLPVPRGPQSKVTQPRASGSSTVSAGGTARCTYISADHAATFAALSFRDIGFST